MKSLLSAAALWCGLGCGLVTTLTACAVVEQAPPVSALHGQWANTTEGNLIGIRLDADNNCELFVERFLQPRTERGCRFELLEGTGRYLVFLKDKHGLCGNDANYEFDFDAEVPQLRFHIGGSTVVMYKDVIDP